MKSTQQEHGAARKVAERELLEHAAKAVGNLELVPDCGWIEVLPNGSHGAWWNPRHDDGDSRRLEVALSLDVRFHTSGPTPAVTASSAAHPCLNGACEPWGSDKGAATRLAVLRAAAEIGRTM